MLLGSRSGEASAATAEKGGRSVSARPLTAAGELGCQGPEFLARVGLASLWPFSLHLALHKSRGEGWRREYPAAFTWQISAGGKRATLALVLLVPSVLAPRPVEGGGHVVLLAASGKAPAGGDEPACGKHCFKSHLFALMKQKLRSSLNE